MASSSALQAKTKAPRSGWGAATTLSLLRYQRSLCLELANKVSNHWQSLAANDEATIQSFALHRGMSDLAAARAAGDLIRQFLPKARVEAGGETGSSLSRLRDLQTQLCDVVALPRESSDRFDARVQDLGLRIEDEEQELGRLLRIDDERLSEAIEPYLTEIQVAGVEAEGEFLDYLESLRPKPQPPTMTELMVQWYPAYSASTKSAKQALSRFLVARKRNDVRALGSACRELSAAALSVVDQPQLFRSPDRRSGALLKPAYQEMHRAAVHCVSGRFDRADKHLETVQRQLSQAARSLARYGLRP